MKKRKPIWHTEREITRGVEGLSEEQIRALMGKGLSPKHYDEEWYRKKSDKMRAAVGGRHPSTPSSLLSGLVGYWKLEEASGTRIDSTGHGNHLTPSGASLPANAAGRLGNAASFDGGGVLSKADNADLSTGEVDFTFACWVYVPSVTTKVVACKSQISPAAAREWTLATNGSFGSIQIDVWNTLGSVQSVALNGNVVTPYDRAGILVNNAWHFAACGLNTTTGKLWIRAGSYLNSATKTITISDTASAFGIGAYADNGASNLVGRVDEAGFWRRVLTDPELAMLLNGGAGLSHPFEPSPNTGAGIVLCVGDSLTHGNTVAYQDTYPPKLSILQNRNAACNMGQSGQRVDMMITDGPTYIDPAYLAGAKNVVILWGGTNDLFVGASAATTWGRIKTYCTARKAVGFKTIVLTITARADLGWTADMETQRNILNAYILGGDVSIDAVADVASLPDLQDPNNTTYFVDKLHLTAAGLTDVAGLVNTTLSGI